MLLRIFHFPPSLLLLLPLTIAAAGIDKTRLPIGDGRVSNSPEAGHVWPCRTQGFGTRREHTGPWIKDDGTYDFLNKPAAPGEVSWPSQLSIRRAGSLRLIEANALPNHPTGIFPKSASDPTYQYAPNPHPIKAQDVLMELPSDPVFASAPSCVPMGAVGILLTGGLVFNALDANGQDAVAHEIQDKCQGHPERNGAYHYHNLSTCQKDAGSGHSPLVGYAFDGFGIFGHRGEDGRELVNADLDSCHGHTHTIDWDGKTVSMYHYHATWEYPYTVGCFRGQNPKALPLRQAAQPRNDMR